MKVQRNKTKYDKNYFLERDYLPPHLLNVLEILLEENKVKKVLEVGVGSGKLMNKLRDEGYHVSGIDISPVSVKLTGAKLASATDLPFKANSFDCVIGISIIEHLTEKEGHQFIAHSKRVLKNGGLIFLVTPNYSSPMRKIQGKKWFGYSDKTHIYFYNAVTLKKLLEQYNFQRITSKFKIHTPELEWPLPSFVLNAPKPIRILVNRILVSSTLALYRDSIWIMGTVNK